MTIDRPEDAHRRFAEAFNAGDLDAILSLYEPEAKLAPQPGQLAGGHAAIRSALERFLALKGTMTIRQQYAVTAGDLALTRAAWTLRGTDAGGAPVALEGTTIEVLRRQRDGRWLFVIDLPAGTV